MLYKITGKTLIITTSNITTMSTEYMDKSTQPNLPCLTAINMSISIPVVFIPIYYKGCYYADGGLSNNFPIDYLDDGKNEIIGIYSHREDTSLSLIPYSKDINTYHTILEGCIQHVTNFFKFVVNCMELPILEVAKNKIKNMTVMCKVIQIGIPISFLPLKKPEIQNIMDIFNTGFNKTKIILEKVDIIFEDDI